MPIPFFAFRNFPATIQQEVQEAVMAAVKEGKYILGPQVMEFEQQFGQYLGGVDVIGAGNGYDALVLSLKALGIGKGDEVITAANSFVATANAIASTGATPVLIDPELATANVTAAGLEQAITAKTKAIIPVHLFGQICYMPDIMRVARKYQVHVIEDFAQAQGAICEGKKAGAWGDLGATSFYPVKNLGALGDAGAVVTSDPELGKWVRQFGNYGQTVKYEHVLPGVNSRLDTIQAAALLVKLKYLDKMNAERKRLASLYLDYLKGVEGLTLPETAAGCEHIFHLFSIQTGQRGKLQAHLEKRGIGTLIHYPVPIHLQPAFNYLNYQKGDLPVSEKLSLTSLSLPLFPGLTDSEVELVAEAIRDFFAG